MIAWLRRRYRLWGFRRWQRRHIGLDPRAFAGAEFVADYQAELDTPRPAPTAFDGVDVLDGTGGLCGEWTLAELAAAGCPARLVSAYDIGAADRGLIVLLPARSAVAPVATHEVFTALATRAAVDDGWVGPILVVWFVDADSRRAVAVSADRVDGVRVMSNHAELLLGRSWEAELRRHSGDVQAAVRRRGQRIAAMISAASHNHLGGLSVTTLCAHLARLDPGFLHALVVRAREHPGSDQRWLDARSVIAAFEVLEAARPHGGTRPSG